MRHSSVLNRIRFIRLYAFSLYVIPIFLLLELEICSSEEKTDLVIGAEYNVHVSELRIFLASLRASGCIADVVLFSGRLRAETSQLAEEYGATLIEYDFEMLNKTYGPIGVHRFHLYRLYLENRQHLYRHILHTDVRDVMFQDDPFARINAFGGGVFFLESNHLLIGTSPTNRGWMTENCTVYKKEGMLERTKHRLRSCSGNMLGTWHAAYWYSRLMEEEQQRTADAARGADGSVRAGGWCADQAVHQALLWTGAFAARLRNVTTLTNEDGPLCTMGDVVELAVDDLGEVRNARGEPYAVVHQYDRHRRVRDTLLARYASEDGPAPRLHPAYVPGYRDAVHYGNPALIRRHLGTDTRPTCHAPACAAAPRGPGFRWAAQPPWHR